MREIFPMTTSSTPIRRASLLCILAVPFLSLSIVSGSECDAIAVPAEELIWCDDFEDSDLPPSGNIADNYYDYQPENGRLKRVTTRARNGAYSLQQEYLETGDKSAGYFFRTFGRSPVSTLSHNDRTFRQIFWRMFVLHPDGFIGFPSKLSRATVFATADRAQAMIGHIWIDGSNRDSWILDPASGTDAFGNLQSTKWNDFPNLRWLGQVKSTAPIKTGQWQCVEAKISLNSPGLSNGDFAMWIDEELVATKNNINWLGSYSDYGINAVMFESYWGEGSHVAQTRYIDSIVIAESRIGCSDPSPKKPSRIRDLIAQ
ncbi:polysaccharide lyase [Lentisalinibacter sediminis]|uniref:polysaccharide lyase n=1 Tax=Lentisalinibacter sediminis TaxID=2992237 RepID=UPI003863C2FC